MTRQALPGFFGRQFLLDVLVVAGRVEVNLAKDHDLKFCYPRKRIAGFLKVGKQKVKD